MADIHIINWNHTTCYQLHGAVSAKVKAGYEAETKYGAHKGTCKWAKFDHESHSKRDWKGF